MCVCLLRLKTTLITSKLNVGDCCYISSYFRSTRGANVAAPVELQSVLFLIPLLEEVFKYLR